MKYNKYSLENLFEKERERKRERDKRLANYFNYATPIVAAYKDIFI